MPRLLSSVNGSGQVGISSDGTDLGNMTRLDFESNRVDFDTNAGVATVFSNPLTIVGL
ncbi:hypothetical protein SynMITS9220M01_095 [Synechococcus phage SynMITS9220M01]|nr:hypothetical protein SynMITS9220M01_095 [Synechococcus phage SynMITS9220M01]